MKKASKKSAPKTKTTTKAAAPKIPSLGKLIKMKLAGEAPRGLNFKIERGALTVSLGNKAGSPAIVEHDLESALLDIFAALKINGARYTLE
jgi:hypothetical protein